MKKILNIVERTDQNGGLEIFSMIVPARLLIFSSDILLVLIRKGRESIRNFRIILHGECCFIFLMSGDVVRVAVVDVVPVADVVLILLWF